MELIRINEERFKKKRRKNTRNINSLKLPILNLNLKLKQKNMKSFSKKMRNFLNLIKISLKVTLS